MKIDAILGSRMAALATLAMGIALLPATADTLYDNHAFNSSLGGYGIRNPFSISDSFTMSTSGLVTGVSFVVILTTYGDSLLDLDWSITSAAFAGTTYASGTSAVPTQTFTGSASFYNEVLAIPGLNLASGTYWLQLGNAIVTNGDNVWWAESNGPSQAYQHFNSTTQQVSPSEAFKITGASLPEPGGFLAAATSLAAMVALIRSRLGLKA